MPTEHTDPTGDIVGSSFQSAVLKPTMGLPDGVNLHVRGYDFNRGLNYEALFDSFLTTGFQATHFGQAVDIINMMLDKRAEPLPCDTPEEIDQLNALRDLHPNKRMPSNCTIFLAYTSNMVSCGVRETIRFLAQHNMIDVLVTSAGGVEEDFVKCLSPAFIGDFDRWSGHELRGLGVNRTGNLLFPNQSYVEFEQWLTPILDQMWEEQQQQPKGVNWTPSKLIDRLGKEINDPNSIYYWCHKNQIPVFCPGLTDGSLGDIMFSHTFRRSPYLRVDVVEDVRRINLLAIYSRFSGMIVLGGGISKHHTFNANLMRNGSDYCVLVNTAHEFDGSDSGARPDEAVSWGKIRGSADPVKVTADATLVFPLLVARTFAKRLHNLSNGDCTGGDTDAVG